MTHATLLFVAARPAWGVGIAHSVLGERYLLMRMFRRPDLPVIAAAAWYAPVAAPHEHPLVSAYAER